MLIYVWAQSQQRLVIKVWSWEEAPKVCLPVALKVFTTLEEFCFVFFRVMEPERDVRHTP